MESVLLIVVAVLVAALAVVVQRWRQAGGAAGAGDHRTRVVQLEVQMEERDRQLNDVLSERDAEARLN